MTGTDEIKKEKMSSSCVICLEETVVSVKCPGCNSPVHPTCVQNHLLNTVLDSHCPSCSKVWDYEFLAGNLPKAWLLGPYKQYREGILLDREKSLLPETQDAALDLVRQRKLTVMQTKQYQDLRRAKSQAADIRETLANLRRVNKKDPAIESEKAKQVELRAQIQSLEWLGESLRRRLVDPDTGELLDTPQVSERVVVRQFIHPCPAPDCRGFLSNGWKCKLCLVRVCARCGEIMAGETHTCNEDTLASFTLIRRDSKPCPKCGVPITKISGCDHMFCTDCKTAFSWRTGEIHETGNSNPHYWQWRNTQARQVIEPREGICVDPRTRRENIMRNYDRVVYNSQYGLKSFSHRIRHLHEYDMRDFLRDSTHDGHRDLRIKYLLKEITEDEWRVSIQRVEKRKRKAKFIANIIELFVNGTLDILEPLHSIIQRPAMQEEIEELRRICNQELNKIPIIFGSKTYQITDSYDLK